MFFVFALRRYTIGSLRTAGQLSVFDTELSRTAGTAEEPDGYYKGKYESSWHATPALVFRVIGENCLVKVMELLFTLFFLSEFLFYLLSGSVQNNLQVSQNPGSERGFTAGEVVNPFPLEFSVKTHM